MLAPPARAWGVKLMNTFLDRRRAANLLRVPTEASDTNLMLKFHLVWTQQKEKKAPSDVLKVSPHFQHSETGTGSWRQKCIVATIQVKHPRTWNLFGLPGQVSCWSNAADHLYQMCLPGRSRSGSFLKMEERSLELETPSDGSRIREVVSSSFWHQQSNEEGWLNVCWRQDMCSPKTQRQKCPPASKFS